MRASWKRLLANRQVRSHKTSSVEIAALRRIVARDLADAALPGLSPDRQFATAYNAVLLLSHMAIACAGFRVAVGIGHHWNTFEALRVVFGKSVEKFADYFDACRRKRNLIDYARAEVASQTEAGELLREALRFRRFVETWIAAKHGPYKA